MWTFTGGSLFGGVLVMGLSFISPWSKSSQDERLSYVEQKIREIIIDIKSTPQMTHVFLYIDKHIHEAVSFLNESLNTSTETRLHEVLRKQNEVVNKTEEYKQNTKAMITQEERRCRVRVRNVHKSLVRMLNTFDNKTGESFRGVGIFLAAMADLIDLTYMKAGTWGLLVAVMGVVELILFILVCKYLSRPTYTIFNPPPPPQILVPIPYT